MKSNAHISTLLFFYLLIYVDYSLAGNNLRSGANPMQSSIQGNSNIAGQAITQPAAVVSQPVFAATPTFAQNFQPTIASTVVPTTNVGQTSSITGNNNVVGQLANTTSAVSASTASPFSGTLGSLFGVIFPPDYFAGSTATPTVGVIQASDIQGSNNTVGQQANTAAATTAVPTISAAQGQAGAGVSNGPAIASSAVSPNVSVGQTSNIVGSGNVVGQSANTLVNTVSLPVASSGPSPIAGTTGNAIAGSTVTPTVNVDQASNIRGNNNVVGQSADTQVTTTSIPIAASVPISGTGTGQSIAASTVNPTINVGQTSNIQGSNNVVGQQANTQANTTSIPIVVSSPNSATAGGFGSVAASTVTPTVGVSQASSIQGNSNVVGQQANTQANTASIPIAITSPNGFGGFSPIAASSVTPSIGVSQNSNIAGNNNVVGQSANTQATTVSIPIAASTFPSTFPSSFSGFPMMASTQTLPAATQTPTAVQTFPTATQTPTAVQTFPTATQTPTAVQTFPVASQPTAAAPQQTTTNPNFAASQIASNVNVNQNSAINGSNNTVSQTANTQSTVSAFPSTGTFPSSSFSPSTSSSQPSFWPFAAANSPFGIAGNAAPAVLTGPSGFAFSVIPSNVGVNQSSNIQGNNNTVGQTSNTISSVVAAPVVAGTGSNKTLTQTWPLAGSSPPVVTRQIP